MKMVAMAGMLAAVVLGGSSVGALAFRLRGGKVVGEIGLEIAKGWTAVLDRTRFASGPRALDLGGRPGQVLELRPETDAQHEGATIRVFRFKPDELAGAGTWMERERRRFPVEETARESHGAFPGVRLDYRGPFQELIGPVASFGVHTIEKARVVAVALQGKDGVYAFELIGSEDEVARALPQFDAMLAGVRSLR